MQKDVFLEQLVKRKMTPFDMLMNALIILAAIAAVILLMGPLQALIPDFASIFLLCSIGAVIGAIYLIYSKNVEFEYIYTNGELDVDTIIARRRRKRLVSVTCDNVTDIGIYRSDNTRQASCSKVIDATSGEGKESWYMVLPHRVFGTTMLIFEPNAEMLECLKTGLPKELVRYAFNRG